MLDSVPYSEMEVQTEPDVIMMCGLMPFYDSVVEKEFLLLFNSRKAWLDKLIILYLVYQYIITATQSGNWDFVFIMISYEVLVMLITYAPGYSQWRNYIAILLYAPRLTFVFYMARKNFGSFRAGTFTMAVKRVGFHCARFKMPMNFALGVQVPLRHGGITAHTALVALLLSQSWKECELMVQQNPDVAIFAGQVQQLHRVWEEQGEGPACHLLCNDLLRSTSWPGLCTASCNNLMPIVWSLYGDSWMDACVSHRFIIVPLLGYMLPLVTLYIWEMRDRWIFAQERTIPTSSLWQSILQGLPYVIYDVAFHISVAVCLLTDWIKYM